MFARLTNSLFVLPLISAVLLFYAWPPNGYPYLVFIALVPMMLLHEVTSANSYRLFGAYFLGFFVFHLLAAWWMYSSTIMGSLLAHLFNSFYMAVVLQLTLLMKGKFASGIRLLIAFPLLWLAMEFLHFHWELSWPWFTLGHVFADQPSSVQWYSYTGSLGGSWWVLMVNGLLALFIRSLFHSGNITRLVFSLGVLSLIVVPLLVSNWIEQERISHAQLTVLIVQPNIDPRTDKFEGMTQQEQLDVVAKLLTGTDLSAVDLIVLPETMITTPIDEDSLEASVWIRQIRTLAGDEHHIPVFTGAFTRRTNNIHTSDRKALIEKEDSAYVLYNSALLIQENDVQVYHKNQLVPLVEKQPFYQLMKPIRNFVEQSGGFFGRYGTHNEHYTLGFQSGFIAPLICFESAYGGYTASVVRRGAGFIVLVTNDGWWSSPGGYRQHLAYARLRAIETGRHVVRAANTGVSAIITPSGSIEKSLAYGTEGVIVSKISLHQDLTFYTEHGDYLGKLALVLSLFLMVLWVSLVWISKQTANK